MDFQDKQFAIIPSAKDTQANLLADAIRKKVYKGQLIYTQDNFVLWMPDRDADATLPNIRPIISQAPITSIDDDYTATLEDYIISVDTTTNAPTITLPTASSATNHVYVIKDEGNAGSNNIIVDGNASETIDGSTTQTISSNYGSLQIYSNGTSWFIIN